MKKSGQESVQKDRGEWKAIISYQEGGTQKRLTKRTGVKCTSKKGDMRGKQNAEKILRDWRDELIAAGAATSPVILSDAPLLEFCRRYAEAKRYLVKDSTYLGYLSETNRLSKTPLARMPIGDITAEDFLYSWHH